MGPVTPAPILLHLQETYIPFACFPTTVDTPPSQQPIFSYLDQPVFGIFKSRLSPLSPLGLQRMCKKTDIMQAWTGIREDSGSFNSQPLRISLGIKSCYSTINPRPRRGNDHLVKPTYTSLLRLII